jgi:GNAT superfamily N-acetyltransferase
MENLPATISQLRPGSPAVRVCARWRHDAFFREDGFSLQYCLDQLAEFLAEQDYEIALLAEVGGRPAGTCLFVRREIDLVHELTPWLAGLYVAPEFRNRSIGRALVAAIEGHARKVGCDRLHLYTSGAEAYYAQLGWHVSERFPWDGEPFVLMHRDL